MAVQVRTGGALVAPELARNPKVVPAPAPSAPFQLAFVTVVTVPEVVAVPFHALVTTWPLGQVMVTFQALMAEPPAVTAT